MILTFIQNILYECQNLICHFPKTDSTEQTVSQNSTHAGHNAFIFFMCDCDFYQYYTLVLYSLIMICIFTLFIFYLSRLLCVVSFRGENTNVYFISSWQRLKSNKYLQFCRCKCRTSPSEQMCLLHTSQEKNATCLYVKVISE